jgi:hypothetical protein
VALRRFPTETFAKRERAERTTQAGCSASSSGIMLLRTHRTAMLPILLSCSLTESANQIANVGGGLPGEQERRIELETANAWMCHSDASAPAHRYIGICGRVLGHCVRELLQLRKQHEFPSGGATDIQRSDWAGPGFLRDRAA